MVVSGFGKCCAPHPFLACIISTAVRKCSTEAARLAAHMYSTRVCQHLPQLGIALGKAGPESFIPTENGPFG